MVNYDSIELILTDSSNCKRFGQIEDDIEASDQWATLFNDQMGPLLDENLNDWLKREEPDFADYDL